MTNNKVIAIVFLLILSSCSGSDQTKGTADTDSDGVPDIVDSFPENPLCSQVTEGRAGKCFVEMIGGQYWRIKNEFFLFPYFIPPYDLDENKGYMAVYSIQQRQFIGDFYWPRKHRSRLWSMPGYSQINNNLYLPGGGGNIYNVDINDLESGPKLWAKFEHETYFLDIDSEFVLIRDKTIGAVYKYFTYDLQGNLIDSASHANQHAHAKQEYAKFYRRSVDVDQSGKLRFIQADGPITPVYRFESKTRNERRVDRNSNRNEVALFDYQTIFRSYLGADLYLSPDDLSNSLRALSDHPIMVWGQHGLVTSNGASQSDVTMLQGEAYDQVLYRSFDYKITSIAESAGELLLVGEKKHNDNTIVTFEPVAFFTE